MVAALIDANGRDKPNRFFGNDAERLEGSNLLFNLVSFVPVIMPQTACVNRNGY